MSSTKKRTNVGNNTRVKKCGTDAKPKERLSESYAHRVFRRRVERGAAPGSVRAYECNFCGFWHVGTRRPEAMRQRRRHKR
jgi:hypothetical protein